MLSEVAREKKVTIVGGSVPERSGGKLYNTCCVVDKNGELKAKFRKVRITYNFVLSTKSSFSLRWRITEVPKGSWVSNNFLEHCGPWQTALSH